MEKIKVRKKTSGAVTKTRGTDIVFMIVNTTVFVLFTLVCMWPFYYLLINTVSDNELVMRGAVTLYPKGLNLQNYLLLRNVNDFFNSIWITASRSVLGTALMVAVSAFTGYLFSKSKMWKRKLWYRMLIIPMYFNAGLIPWYLTMMNLGLTNNYMAYILPNLVVPFNIILVKTYIEAIPKDLEESAKIDGAGILKIFMRIIWPLCTPILATIAIFGAVNHWNSLQDSLLLMQGSSKLYTLQHRLYIYLQSAETLKKAMTDAYAGSGKNILDTRIVQYTISMVSVIPIMLVYPLLQRYFVKGIMLGAVKG